MRKSLKEAARKKKKGKDKEPDDENKNDNQMLFGGMARSRHTKTGTNPSSYSMATVGSTSQETFIDSGSEDHICGNIDLLHDVSPNSTQLLWGNGQASKCEGAGKRIMYSPVDGATMTLNADYVLYVPGLINFLSYTRLREKGILWEDDGVKPRLRYKGKTVVYINMPPKGQKGLPSLVLRTSRTYVTLVLHTKPGAA